MRRMFLVISFLALVLLAVLIASASLGVAQTSQPVENARPTPTPIAPPPERAPAAPEGPTSPEIPDLPDLIVEKIEVVPSVPIKDKAATIRVTIRNQGPLSVVAGNNFISDLYVDPNEQPIQLGQTGVYTWGCQSSWVPAGGWHVLEAYYIFTDVKTYHLWAQVDTDNHVLEGTENNNVLGPVAVTVRAEDTAMHQTHQDFQLGMASGLDTSHPQGVIRRGIFKMPSGEPDVYEPDEQIDDPDNPPSLPGPTSVNQTRPAMISDGSGSLFAVWEDGRNGGVFNRDVFFSRSMGGGSWGMPGGDDVRVNDDTGTTNQIRPDLARDESSGRLYAVWQDGREGDFDIYFAYSTTGGATWNPNQKLNNDLGDAGQLNPSIAVAPSGEVYVVWQDQRNGNDDIYLARSDDHGLSWNEAGNPGEPPDNYFVTDDPDMSAQNQAAPSVAVEGGLERVIVAWEDWRDPLHPEIYAMWSEDKGQTWGIDVPVTIPGGSSYRREPTLAVQTTGEIIEYWDETAQMTQTVATLVTAIHVAWQQGSEGGADVYYGYSPFIYEFEAREPCPYPYEAAFCFRAPQQISGFVIDSDYALPQDDPGPVWPVEPSWQGQVSLDLVPNGSAWWTYCHAGSTQVYSRGLVLAWSDARSYDEWRYQIRTRRVASPAGEPTSFEPCEDWTVGVVNDNSKVYALRDDPAQYEIYKPAATGAFNPSIVAADTEMYVAWDDDRYDDPTEPGTVRNRDVFMARLGSEPEGIFISPVIDGKMANPQWYVLSWWGVTELNGDILFQTRFGDPDHPIPPKVGTASGGWTAWTGNPGSPSVGCSAGAGCYYDAPGRHIVDEDGNEWFDCPGPECPDAYRYMQYKLILRGPSRRTAVSRVVVHYRGQGLKVYLPLVVRNH